MGTTFSFSSFPPTVISTDPPSGGILNSADCIAFERASVKFSPRHATSPVLSISTPRTGSAPLKRMKLNWGTFTPTWLIAGSSVNPESLNFLPSIARVASSIMLTPRVLLT